MSLGLGMGLGMGQNVAASGGGGGAFSPVSLSPSLWIEADPTKLYTDAGTTLVSADGQAVQQANDKSGNGYNLTQATLASRPLYKTGSGHPYLLFDGTNDGLDNAGATAHNYVDGSGQGWIAFVGQVADVTTNQHLFKVRTAGGSLEQLRLYVSGGAVQVHSASGTIAGSPISGGSVSINTKFVVIAQLSTSVLAIYLNNGAGTTTAVSSALDTSTAAAWIGSNVMAASFLNGQTEAVLAGPGVLSSTDRTNLYNYLNAL